MAEGRVLTHKILMILLFCSGTFALRAQEKNYESHWYWRAGVTASISTYMQARDGGEGPTYDVSLSERYGKYHGPVYGIPPLSFDTTAIPNKDGWFLENETKKSQAFAAWLFV